MIYFKVKDRDGKIRFEGLAKDDAIRHAQAVFRAETVVCTIDEIEYVPVTHDRRAP